MELYPEKYLFLRGFFNEVGLKTSFVHFNVKPRMAGQSKFLFIDRLDATLKGNAGVSNDGKFSVGTRDTFSLNKNIKVFVGDKELENVKISNPRNAVKVQGDITPGEPIDLKISLDDGDET